MQQHQRQLKRSVRLCSVHSTLETKQFTWLTVSLALLQRSDCNIIFLLTVVQHWLKWEITQWVHQKESIQRTSSSVNRLSTTELHPAPDWWNNNALISLLVTCSCGFLWLAASHRQNSTYQCQLHQLWSTGWNKEYLNEFTMTTMSKHSTNKVYWKNNTCMGDGFSNPCLSICSRISAEK